MSRSSCPHATTLRGGQVTCTACSLSPVCLPVAVAEDELDQLDSIIRRGRPITKGDHLFRAGSPFESVFAVRSGTIKTYTISDDGEEQITGFYLPGEVLGVDGLSLNVHTNSAIAMDTATVCEIPFDQLEKLSAQIPTLQRHFFQLMSQEIQADQQLILLLSKKTAEARVAAFLMNLAKRHARRGLSAHGFRLGMPRQDIANFLGLAVETASRVFTRLQKAEILTASGREITILDDERLAAIANGADC